MAESLEESPDQTASRQRVVFRQQDNALLLGGDLPIHYSDQFHDAELCLRSSGLSQCRPYADKSCIHILREFCQFHRASHRHRAGTYFFARARGSRATNRHQSPSFKIRPRQAGSAPGYWRIGYPRDWARGLACNSHWGVWPGSNVRRWGNRSRLRLFLLALIRQWNYYA